MRELPEALKQRLHTAGQTHLLKWWSELSDKERSAFTHELAAIDFDLLRQLYDSRDKHAAVPADEQIAPIPVLQLHEADRSVGEEALSRGEVAVLVVAGGQGTRLSFDHAKGKFPIGPVRNTPLFQILAEKALAMQHRYGRPIPFLVMTSPATHDESLEFFEEHKNFGLPARDVRFFCQGTMPALDLATGKILLQDRGRMCLSPNGHGGCLFALTESGLLNDLNQRGIKHIFYCQVDNPLVRMADPLFLGRHIQARAEVSTKVIPKAGPLDKLGNLALIDGRCGIIEYSDLPERLAREVDAAGLLRFRVGNTAIHMFDVEFLKRIGSGALTIPFHTARKKVECLDDAGDLVKPTKENALKFEMFIFDVLPLAERWTVVETDRFSDFHPVKNATGIESPATARQALSNLAGAWLQKAGIKVPLHSNGDVAVPLEISALFALDAEEFGAKVSPQTRLAGAAYFG